MKILLNSLVLTVCIFSSPGFGREPTNAGGVDFDPTPFLGKRWYGVYLMNNKVGYGFSQISRTTYAGAEACQAIFSLFYQIALLGRPQKISTRERRIYLADRGLVAFTSENDSALGKSVITGKRKEKGFEVTTATDKELLPAPSESLVDYLAAFFLVRKEAPVGEKLESVQFMPLLLRSVRTLHTVKEIESRFVSGVTTRIYHIQSDFPELGIQTLSLIDQNLNTLEMKVGGGLTIREEGETEAKNLNYESDLLLLTSVTPDRPVPSPQEARSLNLRLRGLKNPALVISSPRQEFKRVDDDTLLLRIELQDGNPLLAEQIPLSGPELKPFLKPTVYLQSTHPAIQRLARRIAGGEKNSCRVTEKLVNWVYENLDKSFLAAIPDALDVLKKKSGDCKAHATLFIALARSLGLPARRVSGLVQTPDGKFYYHQWAETYVGWWQPVDPVFGQTNADATHIKLSQGDLSEQVKLLDAIGNVTIEVLEYQTKEETGHRDRKER